MISESLICEVKKDKFYKAVDGVDIMHGYFSIFYVVVIYFRYKSFIKCTKSQDERDLAFYKAKGNMGGAIFLGMFMLFILIGFISAWVTHSNV